MENLIEPAESTISMDSSSPANPLKHLFKVDIKPDNLKERFLCATYEIIAEQGADALSASELIKRTQSSKGALFHHFQTLDHLCLESIAYFKKYIPNVVGPDNSASLEEYLQEFMKDTVARQSSAYNIHLQHFFRDRAVRDERYRLALQDSFNYYKELIAQKILKFLKPGVNPVEVQEKIGSMVMFIERFCYNRVLYKNVNEGDQELQDFMSFMKVSFEHLK